MALKNEYPLLVIIIDLVGFDNQHVTNFSTFFLNAIISKKNVKSAFFMIIVAFSVKIMTFNKG